VDYLEWRENGRRVRLSVRKDPADASARRLRKEAELNAINNGLAVIPELVLWRISLKKPN
jgi:predicted Ser/Thr protein kinase